MHSYSFFSEKHLFCVIYFAVAQDDYKLLTDLNKECDMTYAGLRKIGGNLNKQLKEMTEKRKPWLFISHYFIASEKVLKLVLFLSFYCGIIFHWFVNSSKLHTK